MSHLHPIRATDTQAQSSSRATTQRAGRDGHASILPSCGPPLRVATSIRLGEAAGGPVEFIRRATVAAPADAAHEATGDVSLAPADAAKVATGVVSLAPADAAQAAAGPAEGTPADAALIPAGGVEDTPADAARCPAGGVL